MLKRLSHASFGSTDLSRTVAFYRAMLDCEVAHEFKNAAGEVYGVFLYCRNGTFLEFFNDQAPKPPGGLFRHVCFEVDNLEAMAERFRAEGHTLEIKRGRTDRILQFFVHDPDGTMIEFQQHDAESVLLPYLRGDRA
jgi:catechol 2,3-dioxygenase-like lactoylglutathione lyase family enzyme